MVETSSIVILSLHDGPSNKLDNVKSDGLTDLIDLSLTRIYSDLIEIPNDSHIKDVPDDHEINFDIITDTDLINQILSEYEILETPFYMMKSCVPHPVDPKNTLLRITYYTFKTCCRRYLIYDDGIEFIDIKIICDNQELDKPNHQINKDSYFKLKKELLDCMPPLILIDSLSQDENVINIFSDSPEEEPRVEIIPFEDLFDTKLVFINIVKYKSYTFTIYPTLNQSELELPLDKYTNFRAGRIVDLFNREVVNNMMIIKNIHLIEYRRFYDLIHDDFGYSMGIPDNISDVYNILNLHDYHRHDLAEIKAMFSDRHNFQNGIPFIFKYEFGKNLKNESLNIEYDDINDYVCITDNSQSKKILTVDSIIDLRLISDLEWEILIKFKSIKYKEQAIKYLTRMKIPFTLNNDEVILNNNFDLNDIIKEHIYDILKEHQLFQENSKLTEINTRIFTSQCVNTRYFVTKIVQFTKELRIQYIIPFHQEYTYEYIHHDNLYNIFVLDGISHVCVSSENYFLNIINYGNGTSTVTGSRTKVDEKVTNNITKVIHKKSDDFESNIKGFEVNSDNELTVLTRDSVKLDDKYGYKAVLNDRGEKCIAKLKLLNESRVAGSPDGNGKLRTDKTLVIALYVIEHSEQTVKLIPSQSRVGISCVYQSGYKYPVGEVVSVSDFDPNLSATCVAGIHFFLHESDALEYHKISAIHLEYQDEPDYSKKLDEFQNIDLIEDPKPEDLELKDLNLKPQNAVYTIDKDEFDDLFDKSDDD